jgi:hypothetical protein
MIRRNGTGVRPVLLLVGDLDELALFAVTTRCPLKPSNRHYIEHRTGRLALLHLWR